MDYTFGIYGLGAMGSNLALNLASKKPSINTSSSSSTSSGGGRGAVGSSLNSWVHVSNWEGDPTLVDKFIEKAKSEGLDDKIKAFKELQSFFDAMGASGSKRIILIMVTSGAAVDSTIASFKPFLKAGDIIIDGGNEHYKESIRRYTDLASMGVSFVDLGVSGGMEGARNGASLMAGCDKNVFDIIAPVLSLIAASVSEEEQCLIHAGKIGAGNYVKMVHNGIEYALMQVLAEIFSCLNQGCNASFDEISSVFSDWSQDEGHKVGSYLLDITRKILLVKDAKKSSSSSSGGNKRGGVVDDEYLLSKILDSCGSKGTGKWTVQEAADRGVSCPTISSSLNCRYISALVDERKIGASLMLGPRDLPMVIRSQIVSDLKIALYIFTMSSFAQGFAIIRKGFEDLKLDASPELSSSPFSNISRLCCAAWCGGCIIRNSLLPEMADAFERNPMLSNLLLDNIIAHKSNQFINSARRVTTYMIACGIPCPAFMGCISYYDCLRTESLSTNLIQAQRDYFGYHGFQRKDMTGAVHHGTWS